MNRAERMEPVQKVMDDSERQHAQRVAAAQRRYAEAQKKLAELQGYHMEYVQSFSRQAAAGSYGMALRDFQAFLGRLVDAVRQQSQLVARAGEDLAAETHHWQSAARRSKALGVVVSGWRREERVLVDRREQQDTDERARRTLRASPGEL